MLPISMAGSMRIGWPLTVSPTSTRAHVAALAAVDGDHVVVVGAVGARRRRPARARSRRRRASGRRASAPGSRRGPAARRRARAEALAQGVGELDLVDAVVAAHEGHDQPARLGHHRIGLEHVAGLDAEGVGHGGDRRRPRRVQVAARGRIGATGCGIGARDLGVGRVAGRQRDVVLARRARRHVLVRARAAHHPDVGLDAVPLQADAVADAVVGLDELLVGRVQALVVAIEGVGVLHDELARAQHPGARARLVAALGLEVVEQHRAAAGRSAPSARRGG